MATTSKFFASLARRTTVLKPVDQRMTFSALSASTSPAGGGAPMPILCGRGDKRTKRGKIFKGSYGNWRPKKEKKIERIKDRLEVPRSTPWPLPFKLI
ncbi:OLC1v1002250C1 [Oldenlandia corymbosa var. corymbosa]|uniref:OLC1v1002250C1 n=1 Tax=Oldenlandia corymbosa var. corymbosa TaxID=529605 RepID=A0AAV1D7X7_OLDCO|nr:OLC1v1002250C1 [Oldenlandia corymbosa var. corymbosa]